MVLALLAGRKTQTRRLINPQPVLGDGGCWYPASPRQPTSRALHYAHEAHLRKGLALDFARIRTGDRLWVRESIRRGVGENGSPYERVSSFYAADGARTKADAWPWQRSVLPAIHCPRGLSRITLEVTGVKVERLHDISEEDARAEGVRASDAAVVFHGCGHWHGSFDEARACPASTRRPDMENTSRGAFAILWDSINGKRASWASNPWVWCVSFRRVVPKQEAA